MCILGSLCFTRYWSAQTGSILAEYEEIRQNHMEMVGQPSAVAQQDAGNQASSTPTAPAAAPVEVESLSKLEQEHGVEIKIASEVSGCELILAKDGKGIWLLAGGNKTIPKGTVLAGFGTGQWLPESEVSEGVAFQVLDGDRTLVQLDESSFSSEAQGNQNLTIYKLLLRAETEKQLTEHRMSFLQISRKTNVEAGQDGFDIVIKNAMKFKCLKDPRSQGGEEKVTSKNFFSKCLAFLPTEFAQTIFRYRYERVGQNFKVQRPYVITSMALTLTKDKPLKLS